MPNDPSSQPTQPLTEALLNYFDEREMDCLPQAILDLVAERNKLLDDLQWYISDLGPEHWQNCDTDPGDCYLCDGHVAIRDQWKGFRALGLDQDGEGQA